MRKANKIWISDEFEEILNQGYQATNKMMRDMSGKEISRVEYSRYLAHAIGDPIFPTEATMQKRGRRSKNLRFEF